METLSQRFLETLTQSRDGLYARALATADSPAAAETALLAAVRAVFAEHASNEFLDVAAAVEKHLPAPALVAVAAGTEAVATLPNAAPVSPDTGAPMPADVWARLAAAVQWEAARSASAGALDPESQLLKPDPILAPKRHKPRAATGEFDTRTGVRLMALVTLALVIGIGLTVYVLIRARAARNAPHPANAPTPATSQVR